MLPSARELIEWDLPQDRSWSLSVEGQDKIFVQHCKLEASFWVAIVEYNIDYAAYCKTSDDYK